MTGGGGRARGGWRAPSALVALSLIPVLAGAARLVELAGGPELIPSDSRFSASPVAVVVHIVSALRCMPSSGLGSSPRVSVHDTGTGTVGPDECWPWPGWVLPARRCG